MTIPGTSEEFAAIDQAFYNDGFRLAGSVQAGNDNERLLLHAMRNLYGALDNFVDLFLQKAATEQPCHCKKGCSWCCHQAVFAHTHEFRYLKKWMFAHMDAEQMEKVRKQALKKHRATSVMSPGERLLHKEPCPLLEDRVCSAYEARPVACRIYLSMDVGSCRDEFTNPADRSVFPKLYRLPLHAGRKLNEGFAAGLQAAGLETLEYPMEEGLLL